MNHPILFFADKVPPLIGGMEMHGKYFIQHFQNHPIFPLLHSVTKNSKGQDVLKGTDQALDWDSFSQSISPSFVFFNSGRWIEDLATLRTLFPKAKFIYRTGGNEILKAPLENLEIKEHTKRQGYWVKTLNAYIDTLITNSSYTEERLKALGITCPMKKCVGGVKTSLIKERIALFHYPVHFFCAARFVSYKNHALLIDLMHQLIIRGTQVHLSLAGDGPLLDTIQKRVQEKNLQPHVSFLGPLSGKEVFEELSRTSFYIQLSVDAPTEVPGGSYIHSEGMGRSILEAISAGVFIIAPPSGALPEIITPECGLLVNIEDMESLVSTIVSLLSSPPKQLNPTHTYDWANLFAQYEILFKELS